MSIFEILGFGWVVFSAAIGTAAAMIAAGFGAWTIWCTWKDGAGVHDDNRRVDEAILEVTRGRK